MKHLLEEFNFELPRLQFFLHLEKGGGRGLVLIGGVLWCYGVIFLNPFWVMVVGLVGCVQPGRGALVRLAFWRLSGWGVANGSCGGYGSLLAWGWPFPDCGGGEACGAPTHFAFRGLSCW